MLDGIDTRDMTRSNLRNNLDGAARYMAVWRHDCRKYRLQ